MAVTATFTLATGGRSRTGRKVRVCGTLALSGTYDLGGFAVTPNLFGLGRIDSVSLQPTTNGTVALLPRWDPAAVKIELFETAAVVDTPFDELDAATSVASHTLDVCVEGAG